MKRTTGALLLLALLAGAGCGGEGTAPDAERALSRDAFVAAYLDLRLAALRTPEAEIRPEDRAEVLARHGVTEEDLLRFVEVHGGEVELMKTVWDEVQARLDSIRFPAADTSNSGG